MLIKWMIMFLSPVIAVGETDFSLGIAKILPPGKSRSVAVAEVVGRGPGAGAWEASVQRVKSGIEAAISARKGELTLVDRANLAAIEQENALTGKSTKINAAETLISGQLMVVGRKVVLSITATEVRGQAKLTADIQMDPDELGINIEADLPEADSRVRTLNARAFDIVRNIVKRRILRDTFPGGGSDDMSKMAEKRLQVIDAEIDEWAMTSEEETSELLRLDPEMVSRALENRHEFLVVEGRLRSIDTSRQVALLEELNRMVVESRKSGIEIDAAGIIASCQKVAEMERRTTRR